MSTFLKMTQKLPARPQSLLFAEENDVDQLGCKQRGHQTLKPFRCLFYVLYTVWMMISRVTTNGFSPITPWITDAEGGSDVAKHYRRARQTIGARL